MALARSEKKYLVGVARKKMQEMPLENLNALLSNGRVRVLSLPKLEDAISMSQEKLLRLLRCCPLSDFFGELTENLNERTLSKAQCQVVVCRLIKENLMNRGMSEIEEIDSLFEASYSVKLADFSDNDGKSPEVQDVLQDEEYKVEV